MRSLFTAALVVATLGGNASLARAELVTFEFTAMVNYATSDLFGPETVAGAELHGSFSVDTAAPEEGYFTGSEDAGVYPGAISSWTASVGGNEFSGRGGSMTIYDYDGIQEYVRWGIATSSSDHSMTLNGASVDDGYASFTLIDRNNFPGTMSNELSGDSIPDFASLSLDEFASTLFELNVPNNANGTRAKIQTQITSITRADGVARVPELDPASATSTVALLASATTLLRRRSGRR